MSITSKSSLGRFGIVVVVSHSVSSKKLTQHLFNFSATLFSDQRELQYVYRGRKKLDHTITLEANDVPLELILAHLVALRNRL